MGIYDRDYVREESSGFRLGGDRSMVVNLILLNVGIFVLDIFAGGAISRALRVHADVFRRPWEVWTLATAGFVHDPASIWHIAMNMIVLWFFGRDVEMLKGRMEFLRFYLTAIVLASLAWVLVEMTQPLPSDPRQVPRMLGASGGVMAVMVVYVLHYPRRMFYFWGVLPVPAWLLATIYLASDVLGFLSANGTGVAVTAHLAGAGFGFVYDRTGWNLGRLWPGGWSFAKLKRGLKPRPKLRVHDPEEIRGADLTVELDRILEKISREGQDSLSPAEQQTLEAAARRYQQRRR